MTAFYPHWITTDGDPEASRGRIQVYLYGREGAQPVLTDAQASALKGTVHAFVTNVERTAFPDGHHQKRVALDDGTEVHLTSIGRQVTAKVWVSPTGKDDPERYLTGIGIALVDGDERLCYVLKPKVTDDGVKFTAKQVPRLCGGRSVWYKNDATYTTVLSGFPKYRTTLNPFGWTATYETGTDLDVNHLPAGGGYVFQHNELVSILPFELTGEEIFIAPPMRRRGGWVSAVFDWDAGIKISAYRGTKFNGGKPLTGASLEKITQEKARWSEPTPIPEFAGLHIQSAGFKKRDDYAVDENGYDTIRVVATPKVPDGTLVYVYELSLGVALSMGAVAPTYTLELVQTIAASTESTAVGDHASMASLNSTATLYRTRTSLEVRNIVDEPDYLEVTVSFSAFANDTQDVDVERAATVQHSYSRSSSERDYFLDREDRPKTVTRVEEKEQNVTFEQNYQRHVTINTTRFWGLESYEYRYHGNGNPQVTYIDEAVRTIAVGGSSNSATHWNASASGNSSQTIDFVYESWSLRTFEQQETLTYTEVNSGTLVYEVSGSTTWLEYFDNSPTTIAETPFPGAAGSLPIGSGVKAPNFRQSFQGVSCQAPVQAGAACFWIEDVFDEYSFVDPVSDFPYYIPHTSMAAVQYGLGNSDLELVNGLNWNEPTIISDFLGYSDPHVGRYLYEDASYEGFLSSCVVPPKGIGREIKTYFVVADLATGAEIYRELIKETSTIPDDTTSTLADAYVPGVTNGPRMLLLTYSDLTNGKYMYTAYRWTYSPVVQIEAQSSGYDVLTIDEGLGSDEPYVDDEGRTGTATADFETITAVSSLQKSVEDEWFDYIDVYSIISQVGVGLNTYIMSPVRTNGFAPSRTVPTCKVLVAYDPKEKVGVAYVDFFKPPGSVSLPGDISDRTVKGWFVVSEHGVERLTAEHFIGEAPPLNLPYDDSISYMNPCTI